MDTSTKWKLEPQPKVLKFRFGEEPEIVYFIKTGFNREKDNTYHVVEEDAYGLKPNGEDYLMTASQIKKRFNIDIDEEFKNLTKPKKLTKNDIIILIESMLKVEDKDKNIYSFDFVTLVQMLGYDQLSEISHTLAEYCEEKNIIVFTAKQKENGHYNNDTKIN